MKDEIKAKEYELSTCATSHVEALKNSWKTTFRRRLISENLRHEMKFDFVQTSKGKRYFYEKIVKNILSKKLGDVEEHTRKSLQ